jgi:hypothetical protein
LINMVKHVGRDDLAGRVDRHGELARRVVDVLGRATREYERFCELRRPYIILMRAALLECVAQAGHELVYHGFSGHLLVPPIHHFVRVRVNAPVKLRTAMTVERLHCSESEAGDYIRRDDEDRVRWARFMYGRDIRDPALYDVSINLEQLTLDTACRMVCDLLKDPDCQPTEASTRMVDELLRASLVEVAVAADRRTSHVEVSAQASGDHVTLTGPYLEDAQRDVVLEIAGGVEGVREVEYQYGFASSFGE